jgi:hypothetical protein
MRGCFHPAQALLNTTQNNFCAVVSRRRGRWPWSEKLLTQSEILEDEILARTEGTHNPSQPVPEPQNHDKNLSESSQPT